MTNDLLLLAAPVAHLNECIDRCWRWLALVHYTLCYVQNLLDLCILYILVLSLVTTQALTFARLFQLLLLAIFQRIIEFNISAKNIECRKLKCILKFKESIKFDRVWDFSLFSCTQLHYFDVASGCHKRKQRRIRKDHPSQDINDYILYMKYFISMLDGYLLTGSVASILWCCCCVGHDDGYDDDEMRMFTLWVMGGDWQSSGDNLFSLAWWFLFVRSLARWFFLFNSCCWKRKCYVNIFFLVQIIIFIIYVLFDVLKDNLTK